MHRRFLIPLAAGVLGLVAIAPALSSEPAALAVDPDRAQATTSSTGGDPASDADRDADADPGTDPDPDPGSDADTDSGSDSGPGSGPDSDPDSGTDPGDGSGPDSSGPGQDSGSGERTSSTTCDPPATDRGPAPQVGEAAQTYEAGEAGTVDVERLSETELRIAGASPNDGWTEEVRTASGPRVNVRFTRQGQSPSLIRFAASMDQRGTEIHIRVTSCG